MMLGWWFSSAETEHHLHIDTLWRLALVPVSAHVQGTSFVWESISFKGEWYVILDTNLLSSFSNVSDERVCISASDL